MSTIDLRDAFHTLRLVKTSQKYCGITPYYGSPTYHYLYMGMGMSGNPQIWQQFVDLVFQDDIIKRKQNFDVIMDDTANCFLLVFAVSGPFTSRLAVCVCFSWFSRSEVCAFVWGIFVRGLRVETFVRVLRSSRCCL